MDVEKREVILGWNSDGGKKISRFRYLIHALLLLLPIMFVLPFYSADTYSIIKNTTSHLGAQSTPNAWIMNVAFVLVGISCVLEAWLHLGRFWFHKILLGIFGLSLALGNNDEVFIEEIFVTPNRQGQGIGTKLLGEVQNYRQRLPWSPEGIDMQIPYRQLT